jgi:hypothetical protein
MTGYAVSFNRRHRRRGRLFQDRYKSILCQEDAYLSELVRYIHLNPLRAKMVRDLSELGRYPYSGHSALLGHVERGWQDTGPVLSRYGHDLHEARRGYQGFVAAGAAGGRRADLVGGILSRSARGWEPVRSLRKSRSFEKSDERILGDRAFLEKALAAASESLERKRRIQSPGASLKTLAARVCDLFDLAPVDIFKPGKERPRVKARSLFCYWAVQGLGVSQTELSRRLNLTVSAVGLSVRRGERLAHEGNFRLIEDPLDILAGSRKQPEPPPERARRHGDLEKSSPIRHEPMGPLSQWNS